MDNKIDIIITWVDGNDPEWRAQKNHYKTQIFGTQEIDDAKRFRDWDNIQYIFRGIEQFMPWVNKVHFVTWGHLPKWLNTDCPKLNIVKHSDYIPKDCLPTFNSNCIELFMNRIKGIADNFIIFNDDMFIVKPTKAEDFFIDGVPCDVAAINPQPIVRNEISNIELNNMQIINDYFSIQDIKKNKTKWFNVKKYGSLVIRTLLFSKYSSILGIYQPHIPLAHTKKTWDTLWEKENAPLYETCMNKFRSRNDVNHWLFRSWQIMTGNFIPRKRNFGILVPASDVNGVKKCLDTKSPYKLVCINDGRMVKDFEKNRDEINAILAELLPNKSNFEI